MQQVVFAPDQHAAALLSLLQMRAEGIRPHVHFNCGRQLMMDPALHSMRSAKTILPNSKSLTGAQLMMLGQARASNDGIWIGRVTGNRGKTPCTGDARS